MEGEQGLTTQSEKAFDQEAGTRRVSSSLLTLLAAQDLQPNGDLKTPHGLVYSEVGNQRGN